MTRDLAELFRYDLWANRQWLDTLLKFPEPKRPDEVMTHILASQWIWLQRCNDGLNLGLSLPAKPEAPSVTLAEELSSLWLTVLSTVQPQTVLKYQNLAGEPMQLPIVDIATHVANHGTYHRGHLRGLAEAQMVTDFPDTDFSIFARETLAARA